MRSPEVYLGGGENADGTQGGQGVRTNPTVGQGASRADRCGCEPHPVLSPDDVIAIAREEGLGRYAEQLVSIVQPAWRLLPGGDDKPGATKVGGDPDLGRDESWPLNRRGVPMAFVAQINCAELPAFDPPWQLRTPWRHNDRLVRLFADLLDNPVEPGPAVALQTDPAAPLTRTPAPPVPDPFPPGGEWDDYKPRDYLYRLPETVARLHPFLTAPEIHTELHPEKVNYDCDEQADQYEEWAARLRLDGRNGWDAVAPYEVQHLLGEPRSIHDHVRFVGPMFNEDSYWQSVGGISADPGLATEDAWAILLGLHMEDAFGLNIHDGGALHFLVPVADLAIGRLNRLICDISS